MGQFEEVFVEGEDQPRMFWDVDLGEGHLATVIGPALPIVVAFLNRLRSFGLKKRLGVKIMHNVLPSGSGVGDLSKKRDLVWLRGAIQGRFEVSLKGRIWA